MLLRFQVLTENSYTRAIDWWGLGVLIFEMLVGEVSVSSLILGIFFGDLLDDSVGYIGILVALDFRVEET